MNDSNKFIKSLASGRTLMPEVLPGWSPAKSGYSETFRRRK
jgi:hypothetical protein